MDRRRYKCVDRRIRDAWLATYATLWIFVVVATAFFAWRFYVRPDNRCACGVGWVYPCAEHQPVRDSNWVAATRPPGGRAAGRGRAASDAPEVPADLINDLQSRELGVEDYELLLQLDEAQQRAGLMQNDVICDSNGCKCDSGLVCDAPDWQPATRRWGALLIGVQALAMATSAVLWQWDRLFLGGFELFFRVDDAHTVPWDISGRVNSADATITVCVLSGAMLNVVVTLVVQWVMFHDSCVVVAQSLVVLGWFAMNLVIIHAFSDPGLIF